MKHVRPRLSIETASRKKRMGFSLGEIMLSVAVLLVGILALFELMAGNVRSALASRDVIVASELAQEGVEIVKNIRDNSLATTGKGGTAFPAPPFDNSRRFCRVDLDDLDAPSDCESAFSPISGNIALRYSSANGFQYGSGAPTRFQRYVHVDYSLNPPEQAIITSFVFWGSTVPQNTNNATLANCVATNKCVYVQDLLKPWY